ncbi:MAG: polymerase sigma-70 factor, subfamily, partial [Solirubrobacteraceae bacterium]|nr:polymerase sigma-70 factor, subfamily [Solirubrobacteraceae bacterium]
DRYRERSYRVSSSVCHDEGRAEDAVQEAFLSIWRNRDTYRAQQGTVAAWLLAVVRYRAIDAARRNHRHASRRADDDGLEHQPAPDDVAAQVHARADASRLGPLLARIPELQREVIALAFYGGLTHVEIAARLGLPPGTVKGRMRLGLNRLRDELRRTGLV